MSNTSVQQVAEDPTESDDDPFRLQEERLERVNPNLTPESSPDPVRRQPVSYSSANNINRRAKRRKALPSQGDAFLLNYMGPNHPQVAAQAAKFSIIAYSESEGESDDDSMEDIDTRIAREMEEKERREKEDLRAKAVQEMAADALKQLPPGSGEDRTPTQNGAQNGIQNGLPPIEKLKTEPSEGLGIRVVPFRTPNHDSEAHGSPEQSHRTLLEIRRPSLPSTRPEDSLVTSPTLSAHLKQPDSPGQRLPALQSPSSPSGGPGSPQSHKLPRFSQIAEIANKANESINGIRQRQSSFSMGAPSPYSNGPQRSPFPLTHPSPSLHSETSPRQALSPPSASGIPGAFFSSRRPSQASDYPAPLQSASTTESSYTSTGEYSPSTQPTPQSETHRMSIDGNGPPILPPPVPSMQSVSIQHIPPHGSGGFQCDHPGCTAPPFQTQYLLNSHANVHSQNRPHYCPVSGCPRAEGGKGFKRKNEMIRHGLVHDSPGYVCPFCPDREHKYPRPDNLQRHVRVHHIDVNKDDNRLREVLAQRPEGPNRGRRRRIGS